MAPLHEIHFKWVEFRKTYWSKLTCMQKKLILSTCIWKHLTDKLNKIIYRSSIPRKEFQADIFDFFFYEFFISIKIWLQLNFFIFPLLFCFPKLGPVNKLRNARWKEEGSKIVYDYNGNPFKFHCEEEKGVWKPKYLLYIIHEPSLNYVIWWLIYQITFGCRKQLLAKLDPIYKAFKLILRT